MEETKTSTSFSKWKPIEIMLAVLFLIAPFYYHPNIGGEGLRIPNNITVWMVATIIIWYSLYLVLKRPTFVLPKYFFYIAAFPALITLSGFVTGIEQPLTWLFRLLFIWGGLAFFFSLFQHRLKQGRLDRILFIIVVSALLQGLIGLAQIWLKTDMPFWLPKSSNGVPSGLFQQINNQASYQVTAIMITVYLLTRPFISHGAIWLQLVLFLAVACATFLITISGSRIGSLALILGLLIIIPALWERLKNKKHFSLFLFSLLIGFCAGMSQGGDSENMVDKTLAMQSGYSGSVRLGIYSLSLDLIKQQPVFGYGIGSFPRVWQYAKPEFHKAHPDAALPEQFATHPHNETIFWLLEGGTVAAFGLAAMLFGIMLALKSLGWKKGSVYVAMLLPIGLHTQVELPFYASSTHWFTFIVLISALSSHKVDNKTRIMTVSLTRLSGVLLILMVLAVMASFIHTLRAQWDFSTFYKGEQLNNPFPYAFKNPYLSDQARWIDMNTILNSSLQQNVDGDLDLQRQVEANVNVYVDWGEKRLLNKPNIQLYNQLAAAYFYLGDKSSFCSIINRGLALYPNNESFQQAAFEQC
ncbi:hypothetical protein A9Q79_09235 [Methylophaga sp. 42_25_T18]|nr:hypothetical protein A9Q79_09235 [Methylophaga sp. 42_25_T18]